MDRNFENTTFRILYNTALSSETPNCNNPQSLAIDIWCGTLGTLKITPEFIHRDDLGTSLCNTTSKICGGLLGQLQKGFAESSLSFYVFTEERFNILQYTVPIRSMEYAYAIGPSLLQATQIQQLILPFDTITLVLLLITVLLILLYY